MWICVCVCMCLWVCAFVCISMCVCLPVCFPLYTTVLMCACVWVWMPAYVWVCVPVCSCVFACKCICVCLRVPLFVSLHVPVYVSLWEREKEMERGREGMCVFSQARTFVQEHYRQEKNALSESFCCVTYEEYNRIPMAEPANLAKNEIQLMLYLQTISRISISQS